jgi:hypothetical protein
MKEKERKRADREGGEEEYYEMPGHENEERIKREDVD